MNLIQLRMVIKFNKDYIIGRMKGNTTYELYTPNSIVQQNFEII